MKDLFCGGFQDTVDELLVRHRSVLDVMTKLQESQSRVNRAIAKAVTSCGCVQISAEKQTFPPDAEFSDLRSYVNTHVNGELCEHCREIIEAEIGNHMFYLAALCSVLNLDLLDAVIREKQRLNALGPFHF